MRISIERTGGFAGMRMAATVDSSWLSAEEAGELRARVETAGLFDMKSEEASAEGADQFVYRLTIDEAGRTHTIMVTESEVPAKLRPLLSWLIGIARKRQRLASS